jgi:hypothetical protein
MPGGVKVVQAMGYFEGEKSWSAAFYGSNGVSRAVQLAAMCAAGTVVILVWDQFTFPVIISKFVCNYERIGAWLPYEITLVVVPPPPPAPTPTPLAAAQSSLSTAADVQAQTDPTGASTLQNSATTQVNNFQSALPASTNAVASGQGLTSATAAGAVSLENLGGITTEADYDVSSVNLNPGQTAPEYVTAVNQTVQSTSDVAATNVMSQQVTSAERNLQLQSGYGGF